MNSSNFNELNNLLEKYGLFAFQHRALERMLTFSFKIIQDNSPPLLKEQFVKNETRNLTLSLPMCYCVIHHYKIYTCNLDILVVKAAKN
ncbi:unnamed protein product [Brachionus calyciflorus]|uniref:Uncharacterized protein n=1 Tax=Brachionus calyciflorus TaxID=104777 RepID=A0A813MU70_9BILA|nr:unnamed protein product [Brachionus calyciflorus]